MSVWESNAGVIADFATIYDGQTPVADLSPESGAVEEIYLHGPAVDEVLGAVDGSGNVAW